MTLLSILGLNLSATAAASVVDFEGVDYTPGASNTSNGYQEFNLFIPDASVHAKPAAGWPVIVFVNNASYTASANSSTLTGLRLLAYEYGFAVCHAMVTITDVADVNITNGGMFWDPDDAGWITDDVPEKDVIWIIQKLRDQSTSYEINPNAIGLYGDDGAWAASSLCAWVAFEKDHADSGASTTQEQQSSLPNSVCVDSATFWHPAILNSVSQDHLRDATTTSAVAATNGDATSAHRQQVSPLYRSYVDSTGGAKAIPLFVITAGAPTASGMFSVDSDSLPTRSNSQSSITDAWQGMLAINWLRSNGNSLAYHRKHSTLASGLVTQFPIVDRYILAAQEHPHILAFFRATLGGYAGAETWDLTTDWASEMATDRPALTTSGPTIHRRQTMQSRSRARQERSIRRWKVGAQDVRQSEITRLRAINTASAGSVLTIDFPATASPGMVPVRMQSDSLEWTQSGYDSYSYTVVMEEAV